MKIFKKTILIDLDGVLNQYDGIYDENTIPAIKDGAFKFLKKLSASYKIVLFTSRNLLLASEWIINNNLKDIVSNVTNVKEPSYLIIDDRCINFNGDYTELIDKIANFKVWYK